MQHLISPSHPSPPHLTTPFHPLHLPHSAPLNHSTSSSPPPYPFVTQFTHSSSPCYPHFPISLTHFLLSNSVPIILLLDLINPSTLSRVLFSLAPNLSPISSSHIVPTHVNFTAHLSLLCSTPPSSLRIFLCLLHVLPQNDLKEMVPHAIQQHTLPIWHLRPVNPARHEQV